MQQRSNAEAVVVACGSYTAPLLRRVGVDLPIYPGKGYSATFAIKQPERAPSVSTIDDEVKVAMSRLGDELRVAGTIELSGFDLSLDSPVARAPGQALGQCRPRHARLDAWRRRDRLRFPRLRERKGELLASHYR